MQFRRCVSARKEGSTGRSAGGTGFVLAARPSAGVLWELSLHTEGTAHPGGDGTWMDQKKHKNHESLRTHETAEAWNIMFHQVCSDMFVQERVRWRNFAASVEYKLAGQMHHLFCKSNYALMSTDLLQTLLAGGLWARLFRTTALSQTEPNLLTGDPLWPFLKYDMGIQFHYRMGYQVTKGHVIKHWTWKCWNIFCSTKIAWAKVDSGCERNHHDAGNVTLEPIWNLRSRASSLFDMFGR